MKHSGQSRQVGYFSVLKIQVEGSSIQEPLVYDVAPAVEATFSSIQNISQGLIEFARAFGVEAKKLEGASTSGTFTSMRKSRVAISKACLDLQLLVDKLEAIDDGPLARSIGSRSFLQEIVDAAIAIGYQDARLSGLSILAFPNRLTVDEKGVKIGRRAVTSLRPTALAALLKADAEQARKAPPGLIDALRDAYLQKCPDGALPVPLSEIYEMLTLLPEVRKSYPEDTFVRDISVIDAYGPVMSKDGKRIAFVAATATRMGKGYRAVSPTGDELTYGSIRFIDPE